MDKIHHKIACIIGNGGLGDTLTYVGMVNYITTKYNYVIVACMAVYYDQIKYFFRNNKIKLYPINADDNTTMAQFDLMMRSSPIYDIYAFGHYGSKIIDYNQYTKMRMDGTIVNIIYEYPISYYHDVDIPIKYMTEYYIVCYPNSILSIYSELFDKYPKYSIVHQQSSTKSFDIIAHNRININDELVIDVNTNLYEPGHKYYDIAQKFINLKSVIFYSKLVENASALYVLDSCIHAIALIVNIDKAHTKICYQREPRIRYGFNKFKYYLLINNIVFPASK